MGSAHSRSALPNQIHALIFNQGLPSIFLTINPADINSRVALYFAGVNLDLDAIIPSNLPTTYERVQIIASHPVATAKLFHRLITTVLETMIAGERVLEPVKATLEESKIKDVVLYIFIYLFGLIIITHLPNFAKKLRTNNFEIISKITLKTSLAKI